MKNMHAVVVCLSALLAAEARLLAANEAVAADPPAVLERARSMDKYEHSFRERLAVVVAGGPAMVPYLTGLLEKGEAGRLEIAALGFLVSRDDEAVLAALRRAAFPAAGEARWDAVEALLRIGGPGVDAVMRETLSKGVEPSLMARLVDSVWLLPDAADLRRALSGLRRIAREHPDSRLRTLAAEYGVPRVEAALGLFEAPRSASSRERLAAILDGRDSAFATVGGAAAEVWALERLVALDEPAAAGEIRKFLAHHESAPPGLRKLFLLALGDLEGGLGAADEEWLAAHRDLDPMPVSLAVPRENLLREGKPPRTPRE